MHDRSSTARTPLYDWTRFGRHRLRAPAGVLIDSPLGFEPNGWLGTLWPAAAEPGGWARMLWSADNTHGGWLVPQRLAGGDVLEFGADHDHKLARWYGIVDSYDAVEWLTVQGPYPHPAAAHEHAGQLLALIRFEAPHRAQRHVATCSRQGGRAR
jgi:hypothetical protein